LGLLVALVAMETYAALRPVGAVDTPADVETAIKLNPKRRAAGIILPSVVSIAARREDNKISSGSGFIIDRQGHIVTNKHVIKNVKAITVILADKRRFAATIRGTDSKTDLAILKINAGGLTPARWGDSDEMQAGDDVLAVGNPFGYLTHTVTAGIVSATGRDRIGVIPEGGEYAYEDFIQTDAIINPGNSGGPLVNMRGEVIGVNIAIISETGLAQKVGLAIPSGVASFVTKRLIDEGKVVRGLLGAAIIDIDYDLVRVLKLKNMDDLRDRLKLSQPRGVYIVEVSGKPAIEAKLQKGDVVTEYNGLTVTDTNRLRLLVAKTRPGTTVKLTVIRNGKRRVVPVTLGTQPDK
jgi:serine protease Do